MIYMIILAADSLILSNYTIIDLYNNIKLYLFKKNNKKGQWLRHMFYIGFISIIIFIHRILLNHGSAYFTPSSNKFILLEYWYQRFLSFSYIALYHGYKLIYPKSLCPDYAWDTIDAIININDDRIIYIIIFYIILLFF